MKYRSVEYKNSFKGAVLQITYRLKQEICVALSFTLTLTLEQLIATSTCKHGLHILPLVAAFPIQDILQIKLLIKWPSDMHASNFVSTGYRLRKMSVVKLVLRLILRCVLYTRTHYFSF